MATYKYDGADTLVFPSLFDANGAVLVVNQGDKFDAPDGIVGNGISVASGKASKSAPVVEDTPAVDPAPAEDIADPAPTDPTV
jgi:hypothetical protein